MSRLAEGEIKEVTEMFVGRNYIFSMPEEIHRLSMNLYEQMTGLGQKPSFAYVIRNLPLDLQQQVTVEEVRLNGIRTGWKEVIKLEDVPYE